MVRQAADTPFAALARRRADLASAHFALAYVVTLAPPGTRPLGRRFAAPRLGFAVPKRQLALAVDRNALKRVAREAWRLAPWGDAARPALAMIKLRRSDPEWREMPAARLKKVWRAELDELVARLVRRMASPPPAPARA
jgi:RNase P protein component